MRQQGADTSQQHGSEADARADSYGREVAANPGSRPAGGGGAVPEWAQAPALAHAGHGCSLLPPSFLRPCLPPASHLPPGRAAQNKQAARQPHGAWRGGAGLERSSAAPPRPAAGRKPGLCSTFAWCGTSLVRLSAVAWKRDPAPLRAHTRYLSAVSRLLPSPRSLPGSLRPPSLTAG